MSIVDLGCSLERSCFNVYSLVMIPSVEPPWSQGIGTTWDFVKGCRPMSRLLLGMRSKSRHQPLTTVPCLEGKGIFVSHESAQRSPLTLIHALAYMQSIPYELSGCFCAIGQPQARDIACVWPSRIRRHRLQHQDSFPPNTSCPWVLRSPGFFFSSDWPLRSCTPWLPSPLPQVLGNSATTQVIFCLAPLARAPS